MRGLTVLTTLVTLVTVPPSARALDPTKASHQHLRRSWQIDQGLPQSSVSAILQTADGYLWLGTQEGLVRYDGSRFVVYDTYNSPGLADSQINDLAEGSDRALWIATNRGLSRYAGGTFETFTAEHGLPSTEVHCLAIDAGGTLWLGTRNGLARYAGGELTAVDGAGAPSNADVLAVRSAPDGALWVGTRGGLSVLREHRWSAVLSGSEVGKGVSALLAEDGGSVWAATLGGGLYELTGDGSRRRIGPEGGLPDLETTTLVRDRQGNLWIGTARRGLARYRDGRVVMLTEADGLTSNAIESVFEDREGSLWVGTPDRGLTQLWDGRFTTLTVQDGLLDDMVWAIRGSSDGALWVGSDGGVNRLRDGEVASFTRANGLSHDVISSFYEGKSGMWIGTENGVSLLAHDGTITKIGVDQGLSHRDVRSVLEDREGTVWFGTHGGGVNRYRDGTITVLSVEQGLAYTDVTAMFEDHEGAVWIGTDQGMSRWRDGGLTSFGQADGFMSSEVYSFYEDADHTLWIGTAEGLFWRRGEHFHHATVVDGLPDDKAYTILEDAEGELWMSSNRGIYRVKKADLLALAAGELTKVAGTLYGTMDGMRSSECNHAGSNAGWEAADGTLYFATIAGVATVDPSSEMVSVPPAVVISQVVVDGTPIDHGARWVSPPGVEAIEIHYTAPSFVTPERTTFAYRLVGHDRGWTQAGTRRFAHYANLAPGDYAFEVTAAAANGVQSVEAASFSFGLTAAFYQTVWFYVVAGLVVILLAVGLVRWRLLEHERREALLERIVRERTDQLAQANERLTQLSFQDALTGLHNRRFLVDTIEKDLAAVERAHRQQAKRADRRVDAQKGREDDLLFLMIDLDHFKSINDTYGHAAGDLVIKQAAQLIAEVARASDILVRWGGEEFLMVARHTSRPAARLLAERLRARFAGHGFDLGGGRSIAVTCSIGFAPYPLLPNDPARFGWEDVVAIADVALYAAKRSGRAMWVGLSSTPDTPELDLVRLIREDVQGLVAGGKLEVSTSAVDPGQLIWKAAS